MLWSIGKDSTTLLWLARKAFFGRVPFPLVHIDTNYKYPQMIEYRDRMAAEWGVEGPKVVLFRVAPSRVPVPEEAGPVI